ncbi:DUF488 family protein [Pseudosulfitobacter sp. SM2401]|uniref:DUF488 domain-containing protein n=1 Tax=Pseudosulfitobacter sp. SM2401 TaxID=3350098 RepID=UPI0036F25183
MSPLFTIGYEGASIDSLIQTLLAVNIKVLADVRELPLSRKKGLSKNGLAARLDEVGIEYIHFKTLGDPKAGRTAAKSGNYAEFERIFSNHLATDKAQDALAELLKVANEKLTCMMCFERCANVCHRSYIADQAALSGFDIYNLIADAPEKYIANGFEIPRYNPRKSLTAAE